jgi:hypothetical protein
MDTRVVSAAVSAAGSAAGSVVGSVVGSVEEGSTSTVESGNVEDSSDGDVMTESLHRICMGLLRRLTTGHPNHGR